jgi:hypothetical protein
MKISAEVVGLGFAHAAARVEDIRRRAAASVEAERAAREARLLAERSAEDMSTTARGRR